MKLERRINSFRFAFQGLSDLFRSQTNARIHLVLALAAACAGAWLSVSRLEWVIIVLCIAAVLAVEALNTALEYLTDLVSPDYHPLAGKVKDAAAAAVLLTAMGAAVAGGLIFLPKLYALIYT